MKNKDAIEGVLKVIISRFHSNSPIGETDDTEYIRNIRTIIEGADMYIKENKDALSESDVLSKTLYLFARENWITSLQDLRTSKTDGKKAEFTREDVEYYKYYYDYIYHTGEYPR